MGLADPGSLYIKYGNTKKYLGKVTSMDSVSRASLHDIVPPALGFSGETQNVETAITTPKTYISLDAILDCSSLGLNFYQCIDYLRAYQRFYTSKTAYQFRDFLCIQLTNNNGWWFGLAISEFSFKAHPGKPTLITISISGVRTEGEGYVADCASW
jgi:hypothetical protein